MHPPTHAHTHATNELVTPLFCWHSEGSPSRQNWLWFWPCSFGQMGVVTVDPFNVFLAGTISLHCLLKSTCRGALLRLTFITCYMGENYYFFGYYYMLMLCNVVLLFCMDVILDMPVHIFLSNESQRNMLNVLSALCKFVTFWSQV